MIARQHPALKPHTSESIKNASDRIQYTKTNLSPAQTQLLSFIEF